MRQKEKILAVILPVVLFSTMLGMQASAATKTTWKNYFSWDETKVIKKLTKDHIYSLLKNDSGWKNLISDQASVKDNSVSEDKIKDGAVSTDKLANGAVTVAKMSSNSCTSGQVLKYNGSLWACAADSDSGGVLGNTIESGEITDGTIVDADVNASAAIVGTKITPNFGSQNIVTTGNVGIGITNPIKKLEVSDEAKIDGLRIGQGGGDISTNTAFGVNALNVNTTGDLNTAIGSNALESNTTGNENLAIGMMALKVNTTGHGNTAVGGDSLISNVGGSNNVALGYMSLDSNISGNTNIATGVNALFNNTTGSGNVVNGYDAFKGNTTGSQNVAYGMQAGMTDASDNYIQTSGNGVYLGYGTRALADGGTNEIVVGSTATGVGSNSVVLGNDSITKTVLKGNVGIGTTSPSGALDVTSTTKGVVIPRMTKTQRDAISSPVAGTMVYQTDNTPGLRMYNGTNWMRFTETAD